MPYYPEINVLFIHIPKTGGTVIEKEMKKKYKENLRGRSSLFPSACKWLQHQFYITLHKHKDVCQINFNEVKSFTVVRNPYDRIISDLFWKGKIRRKDQPSADKVYHVIKNNYLYKRFPDNHNVPQYKFITDENEKIISNIKIFRTEKLNEDNKILNKYLDIDINIQRKNVNKDYSKYLNKDSINLINNFYRKDFELFNYKIKSC